MVHRSLDTLPSEFAALFDTLSNGNKPVMFERQDQVVAVLLPIQLKEELLEQLEDLEDIRDADAAVDEYERTGKAIPWEQIKEEDGLV